MLEFKFGIKTEILLVFQIQCVIEQKSASETGICQRGDIKIKCRSEILQPKCFQFNHFDEVEIFHCADTCCPN